jgi:uncharacterized protein (DUF2062 family)
LAGLAKLKTHIRKTMEEKGSERKIALGFAIGVFISFTPFLSLHTITAIAIGLLFRFNKVAIITGAWVNNHFSIPFVFYISYKLGVLVVGGNPVPPSFEHFDIGILLEYFKYIGVPLIVGTTITGLIASVISYYIMYYAIQSVRRKGIKKGGSSEGIKV